MAHDSQIVNAKDYLKLSYGGPSQRQAPGTNQWINALRQDRHAELRPNNLVTTSVQILLKKKTWQIIRGALSWTIFEQISFGIPSS